jgi:ABC-type proline/glycine betaine transport system permease subunit
MEFDQTTTAGVFVGIIALGTAALLGAPMMTASTVLTMVTPSMAVFGLVCLALGVRHGEYRARTG